MPTKYLRALRFSKACALRFSKACALRFSKGILLALACTLAVAATAQPTWRFHLAFEDGTGAKDTIWFVFDTTATIWLPEPGFSIDAGEMINDYFFFEFNNDPWGHEFYLGRDDSVLVQPSLPNTYVFPTIVNLGVENDIGMADFLVDNGPLIVPNPGLDHVRLKDAETVREIHVFGMEGRPCLQWSKSGTQADLNVADLPMGLYMFRLLRTDGSWQQVRWIKSRQP
jgi:hypothetical protein